MRHLPLLKIIALGVFFAGVFIFFNIFATSLTKSNFCPRSATVPKSSDPSGDEWPMFRGALNHTGVSSTTPVSKWGPLWITTTSGQGSTSPIVASGCVYLGGGGDNNIYCFDAQSGEKLWNYSTGNPVYSAPAFADGRLYVSNLESFFCLYANGTLAWQRFSDGGSNTCPAVSDGLVYTTSGNLFYSLNATTGTTNWSYSLSSSGMQQSSPAVVGEWVYVGSDAT